jgi:hypothetical protein
MATNLNNKLFQNYIMIIRLTVILKGNTVKY